MSIGVILQNTTVEIASLRSTEMLLTLPRQLTAYGPVTVVTSYPERRALLAERNPKVNYVLDTEFRWDQNSAWTVVFDTYIGIGKHMLALLNLWDGQHAVIVGAHVANVLPGAASYEALDPSYPVEVRYDAHRDIAEILSELDVTPGANILVETDEVDLGQLALPYTEVVRASSNLPTTSPQQRVILAPTAILDLLSVTPILTVISRPRSKGLAQVHARLVGNQPGGLAYRLYTPNFFQQLPVISAARTTPEFLALKSVQQGIRPVFPPSLTGLASADYRRLTPAGDLALRTGLSGRWARVLDLEAQPYAAIVLAALLEPPLLFQPAEAPLENQDILTRIDERVQDLRLLFEAPTDLEVLLRIWEQYRDAGFPEPKAWAQQHYLMPGVFARVVQRIEELSTLLNADRNGELALPRTTLTTVFGDQQVTKISEPQLYRGGNDTLYEYDTSIPISRTKQAPPERLLIIHTTPGASRFSQNVQITYALDVTE